MRWIQILMVAGTALFVGLLLWTDHDARFVHLVPPFIGPADFPGPPRPVSDDVLYGPPNSIVPICDFPPAPPFALTGVLTSSATSHGGVAFLKSNLRGADLMAWKGKGIQRAGILEAEFSEWMLGAVGMDSATFRVGSRHVTLRIRYTD